MLDFSQWQLRRQVAKRKRVLRQLRVERERQAVEYAREAGGEDPWKRLAAYKDFKAGRASA